MTIIKKIVRNIFDTLMLGSITVGGTIIFLMLVGVVTI